MKPQRHLRIHVAEPGAFVKLPTPDAPFGERTPRNNDEWMAEFARRHCTRCDELGGVLATMAFLLVASWAFFIVYVILTHGSK